MFTQVLALMLRLNRVESTIGDASLPSEFYEAINSKLKRISSRSA